MRGVFGKFFNVATQIAKVSSQTTVIALGMTVLENLSHPSTDSEAPTNGSLRNNIDIRDVTEDSSPSIANIGFR